MFKKIIGSYFIALLVLCFVCCLAVCAEEYETFGESFENPIYSYLGENESETYYSQGDTTDYKVCADIDEAKKYMLECALNRESTVNIQFTCNRDYNILDPNGKINAIRANIVEILDSMFAYSPTQQNGKYSDYLKFQYKNWTYSCQYSTAYYSDVFVTYTINWFTTKEQEDEVDIEVKKILDELNVYNASDFKKVKAVNDYIIDSASYVNSDIYNNAENKTIYHSAYSAIIMKETVCQGYALMMYRLLRELGISTRIVSGTAGGGPHAWNIVRVGTYYYFCDTTWDDGLTNTRKYFLKIAYKDHILDAAMTTEEFQNSFPLGSENYISGDGNLFYVTEKDRQTNNFTAILNIDSLNYDGVIMGAVYKFSRLYKIVFFTPSKTVPLDFQDFNEDCTLKLIWIKSLSDLKPLCEPVTVE